jgi:hypothetical protein
MAGATKLGWGGGKDTVWRAFMLSKTVERGRRLMEVSHIICWPHLQSLSAFISNSYGKRTHTFSPMFRFKRLASDHRPIFAAELSCRVPSPKTSKQLNRLEDNHSSSFAAAKFDKSETSVEMLTFALRGKELTSYMLSSNMGICFQHIGEFTYAGCYLSSCLVLNLR